MIYAHSELPPRQRSARNDPSMRDGDSGHGNPGDAAGDLFEVDSDTDVGDANEFEPQIDEDEELSGANRETLREFRELQEEVADNNLYSEDEAVDATILSRESDALGVKAEEPSGVVQPTDLTADAGGEDAEQPVAKTPTAADVPFDGYETMTVKAIAERARDLDPAEVTKVLAFEKSNRNRKSLVLQLERIAGGRTRPRKEVAAEQ